MQDINYQRSYKGPLERGDTVSSVPENEQMEGEGGDDINRIFILMISVLGLK